MNLDANQQNEETEEGKNSQGGRREKRERQRVETQKENGAIWVGSGSWEPGLAGFGGGVWWFRSPPARGASVSGGGPDHELPHPPRATATNPLSPFTTTTTATHPTQNPLAGSASLKLLLLLHVYLIF